MTTASEDEIRRLVRFGYTDDQVCLMSRKQLDNELAEAAGFGLGPSPPTGPKIRQRGTDIAAWLIGALVVILALGGSISTCEAPTGEGSECKSLLRALIGWAAGVLM